ncbi:TPA: PapB/FocB family fimbrial expression transcriptional regulator [Escherichia coli]
MTKGNISERDFDILIKLSGIHSEKAILALKKYYVDGVIRKIVRKTAVNRTAKK